MIVRRWHATAANEKRYVTHFRRRVMPELRRLAGYRGALVLRRRVEAAVEIEVLTFWVSMASVRRSQAITPTGQWKKGYSGLA